MPRSLGGRGSTAVHRHRPGGRQRPSLAAAIHPFPRRGRIGARNDPELAYRGGRATAAELALAGINLDFAPVLDVNSNPDNPIIGARAFGADPQAVMSMS